MTRRGLAATLTLLIALVIGTALLASPPRTRSAGPHPPPVLPRAELLQVLGAPVRTMIADYYWIRTTHATGVAKTAEEYRDIYEYANLVLTLDRDFQYVYQFAGGAIPFNLGREQWVNTQESTDILRRGAERFPTNVMLQLMLAYNLTTFQQKYTEAAEVLARASRLPAAPRYLAPLATRLYAQGGNFNAGLALADSLLQTAEDPETKEAFARRKLELMLEERLKLIDDAAEKYRAREGKYPADIQQLVAAGDLSEIPEDPLGGTIDVGSDGKGFSTEQGRRLRIFAPGDRG